MGNTLNDEGLKLNSQQKLSLMLSAGSDFMSMVTSYYSGKNTANSYNFQAWQNEVNAGIMRQDADNIISQANDYANKVKEQGLKTRGEQRVAMGASGFKVSSASYDKIITETDMNIERNINAIRTEAMSKYAAQNYQADIQDIQAEYYRTAAKTVKRQSKDSALFSGLTGAIKLGAMSYFGGTK